MDRDAARPSLEGKAGERGRIRYAGAARISQQRDLVQIDAAMIEQVLHSRNFIKHYALRMNRRLLGNGLLSSESDIACQTIAQQCSARNGTA